MNKTVTILTAFFISLAAQAQVAFKWSVESSRAAPTQFSCYRGETILLHPVITSYGETVSNYTATVYWQTNGMDTAWWTTNALVFCPAMDVGASSYTLFVKADTTNGTSYRANAVIRMLAAPGVTPNSLPYPVQLLNFSTVSWTNAPWLLPDSAYSTTVSRASTAYGWGPHASAGYLHQGESLFISEPGGGVLFPSESDAFALWLSYSGFRDSNDFFIDLPPFSNMSQTLATREWTKDYVSTGAPPAGLSGQQVTNIVETAREFHVDSYTNVIWRSVYSNGWTWLVAYTNYPAN